MSKLVRREDKGNTSTITYSEQIKETVEDKVKDYDELIYSNKTKDCLPTGSTLLNCACSDNPFGGYALGTVAIGIGDSSSGKSFLMLTSLALASVLERFDDYDLYYDDAEAAFAYDAQKLFGSKFVQRIKMFSSDTIQEFYGRFVQALDNKKPFIYVLDSYDFLGEEAEKVRAEITRKKTHGETLTKKERDSKGGYKTEKVRVFAEVFRRCRRELADTKSLFIVVFQTIDAINQHFVAKTRRGGNAPKFAASHELWMNVRDTYKSLGLEVGIDSGVKVKKNKITGKVREVSFPIYYDYGIDDIRSCIEFLVEQNYWKLEKQSVVIPDWNFKGSTAKLIDHIEKNNLEDELRRHTGDSWLLREETVKINRKSRF